MDKTPTIAQVIGLTKPKTGVYGIEVEVESKTGRMARLDVPVKGWTRVPEGSVRNGLEYISRKPKTKEQRKKDLELLYKHLKSAPVDWESHRTSIHVHINVSDMTMLGLLKYMTAYFLLENLILSYCHPDRMGNLFCLSLADCEYIVPYIKDDLAKNGVLNFARKGNRIKYGALNLSAIYNYGSLEFRSLEGFASEEKVNLWCDMLGLLKTRARDNYENPEHIVDSYFTMEPRAFVRSLLPLAFRKAVCKGNDWPKLLEQNLPIVTTFAYEVNWKQWEGKLASIYKKRPKKKRRSYEDEVRRLSEEARRVNTRTQSRSFRDIIEPVTFATVGTGDVTNE